MEEEDLDFTNPFWRFNLQTFQLLKAKSNLKQVIQNAIRRWKKKICLFRTLFFFNLQTTQPPKGKSSPKQPFQNAIASLLLLSQQKN
jgi:hypothetical protein